MMKKLLLVGILAVTSSVVMQAGPCAANTNLFVLNGMGAGNTCDFGGLLFSNFWISGYNDFGFSNFNGYTIVNPLPAGYGDQTAANPLTLQNYLVDFSGDINSGIKVTMRPNTSAGNWTVTSPFGNSATNQFTFEVKYTVALAPETIRNGIPNFSIINATLDSTYQSNENFQPDIVQETLRKSTQVGQNPIIAVSVNNNNVTQVKTNSLTPNPGTSINVTDNLLMNLDYQNLPAINTITGSTSLTTNSFSNGFTFVPEPMSFALMGAGLLGLGLLRRRAAKK